MSRLKRPPPLAPLTDEDKQKDKLADKFIEGAAGATSNQKEEPKRSVLYLRIPLSLEDGLKRIEEKTGCKKNVFCLVTLLSAVEEKLKLIERDS
jgi:hypothetical protein